MLTLNDTKLILKRHNIRPSRRLGQNFLVDKNIQEKIIDAAGIQKDDIVLEIGPGMGALTGELCSRAKRVIAIEKDRRLYNFLSQNKKYGNLELTCGDILRYDFQIGTKVKVIGNLPYYISSPILTCLINKRDFISSAFFSLQKEFAERLVAGPGSKAYGSISCFTQFYSEPAILFTIKKNAFYPPPKVDSCFLKIAIRSKALCLTDEKKLFKIIRTCFAKRRKTMLNSLYASGMFPSKQEVLDKLDKTGISPTRRPETISLKEFVNLAEALWR